MTNNNSSIYLDTADQLVLMFQESGLGEMVLHQRLEFDHSIDERRLQKALELLLIRHPIYSCRLVRDSKSPYFEKVPANNKTMLFIAGTEKEYDAFSRRPADLYNEPQVSACLFKTPAGDRLTVRTSHPVADAGGTKETTADLGEIYTRLRDDPDYKPESAPLSRGIERSITFVRWFDIPVILYRFLIVAVRGLIPWRTHKLHYGDVSRDSIVFVTRHLNKQETSALANYGRQRGATLNDLLVSAFYRALTIEEKWNGKTALRLQTTVDFRKWYIPSGRMDYICNLSAFEYPYIGKKLGKTFEETLMRVSNLTRKAKKRVHGLIAFPIVWFFEVQSFEQKVRFFHKLITEPKTVANFPPALTNMGPIAKEGVTFDAPAKSAYILVTPIYPPHFGNGVTGYDGTLTLSCGVPASAQAKVESVYDHVITELCSAVNHTPDKKDE